MELGPGLQVIVCRLLLLMTPVLKPRLPVRVDWKLKGNNWVTLPVNAGWTPAPKALDR